MIQRLVSALDELTMLDVPGLRVSDRKRLFGDCADAVRLELDCPQQTLTGPQRSALADLGDRLESGMNDPAEIASAARRASEVLGLSPAGTTLLLPGLFNSGPEHWQSHWERSDATCQRVQQADWEAPRCSDWMANLDAVIAELHGSVVLVSHSSSCALVAHWSQTASAESLAKVRGALLVAPSDPEGSNYPVGPTGFAPMPLAPLPFRSIVVVSTNDEYVTPEKARSYAAAWGSELVDIGAAGHINSASGLGSWPDGYALLERLRSAQVPQESHRSVVHG